MVLMSSLQSGKYVSEQEFGGRDLKHTDKRDSRASSTAAKGTTSSATDVKMKNGDLVRVSRSYLDKIRKLTF